MVARSMLFPLPALAALVLAAPVPAGPEPIAEIPFRLSGNKVFVETLVNGKGPYWFAFDTGSPPPVLDSTLAAELGIESGGSINVGGAGEATLTATVAQGVELTVAGLQVGAPATIVLALDERLAASGGRPLQGLVGQQLPQRYVVAIDYAASTIRVYDKDTYEYDGPGVSVPIQVAGHTHARGTITPVGGEPIEGRFVIDTGARLSMSLTTPFVNEHGLIQTTPTFSAVVGHGIGGEITHPVGRLDSLTLAGADDRSVTIEDPVATFSQDEGGILGSGHISGIVGGEILKKFTVILDYGRKRMILEKNASFEAPLEFDMSGLWLNCAPPEFDTFEVKAVALGSPGAEAGIRAGDAIVSVDGRAPKEITLDGMKKLLMKNGGRVELKVRRGPEELTIPLTLRRLV